MFIPKLITKQLAKYVLNWPLLMKKTTRTVIRNGKQPTSDTIYLKLGKLTPKLGSA